MRTGVYASFTAASLCLAFFSGYHARTAVASKSTSPQVEAVQEPEVGVGVEQVVSFYGSNHRIQPEINVWLNQHRDDIEITRVLQSSDGYTFISIFYKKTK